MKLRVILMGALVAAAPGTALLARDLAPATATATATAQRSIVRITTKRGIRAFKVEVARSAAEQERGLMFRDHLAADAGMIFPMMPPRPASFWMKNTHIALDLIFIKPDGRIESIKRMAKPYDLTPLSSGGSVNAVLEIGGGLAAKLGIAEGDPVDWINRP